jgi:UDPglucose--hexose-1-phosphate uridylyltransferase
MPQFRRHPITGEWVVIAPERAKRPSDYVKAETLKPESKVNCVFCVDSKVYKEKVDGFEDDTIYVAPNGFPAFIEDPKQCSARTHQVEDFYRMGPSLGGHDLVIIKDHDVNLPTFDLKTWESLFQMMQKRFDHFRDICNAEHTLPIYNYKQAAGASISHPHAQIFSSNIVPNTVQKELDGSEKYFQKHGKCVFCAMNDHEAKEKRRIVYENEEFIAYTFFAARFPFEIWVLPKEHKSRFEQEDKKTIEALSQAMKDTIAKLYKTLSDPPLNFYIHSLPNTIGDAKFYHWHLEITPRVSSFGGYELGSGVVIDVMSPEKAAEYLNEKPSKG